MFVTWILLIKGVIGSLMKNQEFTVLVIKEEAQRFQKQAKYIWKQKAS